MIRFTYLLVDTFGPHETDHVWHGAASLTRIRSDATADARVRAPTRTHISPKSRSTVMQRSRQEQSQSGLILERNVSGSWLPHSVSHAFTPFVHSKHDERKNLFENSGTSSCIILSLLLPELQLKKPQPPRLSW
eukprot:2012913-Pleurochrysis_carterae.AAC.2